MRREIKKGGEAFTPALGTPEEDSYFFFLLAFLAVDFFFFAIVIASSLSGGRAEGTGAVLANRKLKMLHDFSAFPLATPGALFEPTRTETSGVVASRGTRQLQVV